MSDLLVWDFTPKEDHLLHKEGRRSENHNNSINTKETSVSNSTRLIDIEREDIRSITENILYGLDGRSDQQVQSPIIGSLNAVVNKPTLATVLMLAAKTLTKALKLEDNVKIIADQLYKQQGLEESTALIREIDDNKKGVVTSIIDFTNKIHHEDDQLLTERNKLKGVLYLEVKKHTNLLHKRIKEIEEKPPETEESINEESKKSWCIDTHNFMISPHDSKEHRTFDYNIEHRTFYYNPNRTNYYYNPSRINNNNIIKMEMDNLGLNDDQLKKLKEFEASYQQLITVTKEIRKPICRRCGQNTHLTSSCRVLQPCMHCGLTDHKSNRCMQKFRAMNPTNAPCQLCKANTHKADRCPLIANISMTICQLCNKKGHTALLCPDIKIEGKDIVSIDANTVRKSVIKNEYFPRRKRRFRRRTNNRFRIKFRNQIGRAHV